MKFFEYPYVIITILILIVLIMGCIGLYFTMKSVRTARETAKKTFSGLSKIESEYEKSVMTRRNRSVIYVFLSLEGLERVYSGPKADRMYERIRKILLKHFGDYSNGQIAAYGKESFVVYNNLGEEDVERSIGSCFREIDETLQMHGAKGLAYVRFGYYLTVSNEVTFKAACKRAKQACSMAEDRSVLYCRWDSSHGKAFEKKINIEKNIQDEIDGNHFFLEYQPILDAETGRIVGAEVLSRLNSQTQGILSPQYFLSAVNNIGLNRKFDYYIFEKNCKWIANDKENRMKYVYTINFSRYTLCDNAFADRLVQIMDAYDIDYSCIAIEIVEDRSLEEYERDTLRENLSVLKGKGMRILLDDFGKGYTSFTDLADFDISIVKVDKSITQNALTTSGAAILRNIIQTAHDLNMKTLCEGVETESQKKAAVEAGCDMLQGFYFYRPMPVQQLENEFEKQ